MYKVGEEVVFKNDGISIIKYTVIRGVYMLSGKKVVDIKREDTSAIIKGEDISFLFPMHVEPSAIVKYETQDRQPKLNMFFNTPYFDVYNDNKDKFKVSGKTLREGMGSLWCFFDTYIWALVIDPDCIPLENQIQSSGKMPYLGYQGPLLNDM